MSYAKEERQSIAQTILSQLGGNRFAMMTGAKNFLALDSGVSFKIGSGAQNGITHVRITLNSMDTYDVEFIKIRGMNMKTVSESNGVYCDMLREIFTAATGFYTSMAG